MLLAGHVGVMKSLERDVSVGSPAEGEARFHSLFSQSYDDVLRYCLRRLPVADANDAASEVFVVAWRRIAEAPRGDEAVLWLYGIARNVVRNAKRSARRSLRLSAKVAGLAPGRVEGPERQVVVSDELEYVLRSLDRLSESDQEILRLRAMERLSLTEISSVLGCTEEAARKRFERAAKRLSSKVDGPASTDQSSRANRKER